MTPAARTIRGLAVLIILGLALSAPAPGNTIRSGVSPAALSEPHANKAVVGRSNTPHLVFVDNQQVFHTYHTSTPQGGFWSLPQQISTGPSAISPAIAVNALGDLAVVYVNDPDVNGMGELFYTYKRLQSSWSAPVRIYASVASEPTIAGYGRDVHLAWVDLSVYYASFQLDFPPTTPLAPSALEEVASYTCCNETNSGPSIAVARRDRCDRQPPIVRVSYFSVEQVSIDDATVRAELVDRQAFNSWPSVYLDSRTGPDEANVPISSSLAANRRTAEFYFTYSFMGTDPITSGGTLVNRLARVDRTGLSNVDDPFNTTSPLLVRVAAAQSSCSHGVRVAWAEVRPGPVFYWPTQLLTDQWPPGISTPAWGLPSLLGSDARDPQPVYWNRCVAGTTRRIRAIHEALDPGGLYKLKDDYWSSTGCSPASFCLDPGQLCLDTVINVASHLRIAGGGFGLPGEVGEVAIEVENDATEPFEDLVTLDVELPAGVELVGIEGEEWLCDATEGRLACFSRLEVFEPGVTSELLLALKSTGESPGDGCSKETPCDQLCVLAEPEEDDNPEDNRACLLLGSVK